MNSGLVVIICFSIVCATILIALAILALMYKNTNQNE